MQSAARSCTSANTIVGWVTRKVNGQRWKRARTPRSGRRRIALTCLGVSWSSGCLRAHRPLRVERPRDDQSQSGRHRQFPGVDRGHAAKLSSGAGFPGPSGNRSVRSRWRPPHLPTQRVITRKHTTLRSARPDRGYGRDAFFFGSLVERKHASASRSLPGIAQHLFARLVRTERS